MGLFDLFKKKKNNNNNIEVPEKTSSSPEENNVAKSRTVFPPVDFEKAAIKRAEFIENKKLEFDSTLQNLKKAEIRLNPDFVPLISESYEVKYSNLTAKTKRDNLRNFVVIDLETTGLRKTSGIVEISAIKFENFTPVAVFSTLIKPPRKIPDEASKINGITNEMVNDSPKINAVCESLFEFIGNYNLVGHNLEFDLGILEHKGITFGKRKYYDTLRIAQKHLSKPSYKYDKEYGDYEIDYNKGFDVYDHKLETLCDFYSIFRPTAHRGSSDCLATGYLFYQLVIGIVD